MKISRELQPQAIAKELSQRFRQYRIAYPMTRKELAEKSLVSLGTIARFENGNDIGLCNMIKLMKALDICENLDVLITDQTERPSYYVNQEKIRQRARKSKKENNDWIWGDEK